MLKKYTKYTSSHMLLNSPRYFSTVNSVITNENKYRCSEYMKKLASTRRAKTLMKQTVTKKAAVLVSLCKVENKESLLFTKRSLSMPTHKGEVSFPGGKLHLNEDIVQGALRETEEEVGICSNSVEIWGTLPPIFKSLTGAIYPVVGNLGEIRMKDLKIDPNEVAEVFSIPLSFFFDAGNVSYTRYRRNDHKGTYLTPVYKSTPKIWGITAVAVDLTLGILAPTQYTCITTDLQIKSTSV